MMLSSLRFRTPMRIAIILLIAGPPLLTLWNLLFLTQAPRLVVMIGPTLGGVVRETPIDWSWQALRDGTLNKAVTERIASAMPLRPILVRINNEIRLTLFGQFNAPGVFQGKNGQLIEESYLKEYCARAEGLGIQRAKNIIPKLLDIQTYYRSRGATFVYLITPSKVADMPENFEGLIPCPSSEAARRNFIPDYVRSLREANIAVTDTASLIHGLKGKYDVDLFPQGGVHWNDLGVALGTQALIEDINKQAGQPLLPSFSFTYTVSHTAHGTDRDLTDILNVMFPTLNYPVPETTIEPEAACERQRATTLKAAAVGSSFLHAPAELLINDACLSQLNVYFYLHLSRHGGRPYRIIQRNLTAGDLAPLRDARLMILESNESSLGADSYIGELWSLLMEDGPKSARGTAQP